MSGRDNVRRVSLHTLVKKLEHTVFMLDGQRLSLGRLLEEMAWKKAGWPSKRGVKEQADMLNEIKREVDDLLTALRQFYPHALDTEAKEEA
jgi:hypothetical protein